MCGADGDDGVNRRRNNGGDGGNTYSYCSDAIILEFNYNEMECQSRKKYLLFKSSTV